MSVYPAVSAIPQGGSIVSRWRLDEASGNRADSVGSNTLTDVNTVAAGAGFTKPGEVVFDNSADFEYANSEALTRADNASLSITGALTISCWIKLESFTGGTQDLINKWANSAGLESFRFLVANDGSFSLTVSGSGSDEFVATSAASQVSVGVWTFLTAVYRPSTEIEVYINGVSKGNNTTSIPASIFDSTSAFRISNIDNAGYFNWFDGLVQDVIIWGGAALTDAQVLTLYNLYGNKNISDTVTLNESKIASFTRSISETLTLTASKIASITRGIIDTVNLTATIQAVKLLIQVLSDTIGLTASISFLRGYVKTYTETLTLTDTLSRTAGYFRTLTDSMTLSEAIGVLIKIPMSFIAKIKNSPIIVGSIKSIKNRGRVK